MDNTTPASGKQACDYKFGLPLNTRLWDDQDKQAWKALSATEKNEHVACRFGKGTPDAFPPAPKSQPSSCPVCNNRRVVGGFETCDCLEQMIRSFPREAHARKTDPVTSHLAAKEVSLSGHEQTIIDALRSRGPMTQKELSEETDIPEISCSPILRPLARAGILQTVGKKKNPTTGRLALLWAVRDEL